MRGDRPDLLPAVSQQPVHPGFHGIHIAGIENDRIGFRAHFQAIRVLIDMIDQHGGECQLSSGRLSACHNALRINVQIRCMCSDPPHGRAGIHDTLYGADAQALLRSLVRQVEENKLIHVYRGAEVRGGSGCVGNFSVTIESRQVDKDTSIQGGGHV